MRVLDLFAGIGGFSLGLHRAGGFETVAFSETDPYASRVFEARFPGVPNVGDVTTAEYPNADIICAGFPCQDISFAGAGAGLAGARSGLWREVVRAIRVVRPRLTILENVAALLNRGMGTVLGDLAEVGHDAEWHCIPASAVGAPHIRDRIWIYTEPQHPNPDSLGSHRTQEHVEGNAQPANEQVRIVGSLGALLADTDFQRPQGRRVSKGSGRGQVLHAAGSSSSGGRRRLRHSRQWASEPDVGRVAHGIPKRVDRLRCLGNSVVPQIPEMIGRAILAAIADRNPQGGDAQQAPSQRDESGGAERNRTDTGNQREAA